jgi:uncharacterized membrane protein
LRAQTSAAFKPIVFFSGLFAYYCTRMEGVMLSDLERKFFGKSLDELNSSEKKVLKLARERRLLSTNASDDFLADSTPGQRLADSIARIGGSWGFIVAFGCFLFVWVALNTIILFSRSFDPYPFIFLNLILSMLAAIQAPIIMMSQNRQAERDRFMAAKDYEVNLKAEIEVLGLHHKIDMQVLIEIKELRAQMDSLHADLKTFKQAGPAE